MNSIKKNYFNLNDIFIKKKKYIIRKNNNQINYI